MALRKKEKLKDRRVFRSTQSFNTLSKNKFFKLLAFKAGAVPHINQDKTFTTRVAFVISKKKLKRAVHRNKAKRLAEEAFRLSKPQISSSLQQCRYLIFLLEASILEVKFAELKALITSAFATLPPKRSH